MEDSQLCFLLVSLVLTTAVTSQSSVAITSFPASVATTATSFNCQVSYVSSGATASRTVVIDILNSAGSWFGKGTTVIGSSASGSVAVSVSPSGIVSGSQYILKAWLVDSATYTANPTSAWQSAVVQNLTVTFTAGSTTSGSTSSGTSTSSGSSGTSSSSNSCKLKYFGVNLSGAEFGDSLTGHALNPSPGTLGTNYVYSEPGGSASWFHARGMNTFRIPVRWERLQNTLGGALSTADLSKLMSACNYITGTLDSFCLIDIHNYARFQGTLVNTTTVTNAQFQQFWALLAAQFKNNSKVIFGLMNEPYNIDTDTWVGAANAGIAGIRSTGATNTIFVPGQRFTGAHSWNQTNDGFGRSNAAAMLNIKDSGNNFVIEMHQYLDSDYSGTNPACVSATWGSDALAYATSWLRSNKLKGFLGEFGGSNQSLCLTSADVMLQYMENNSDVWTGWTWWSAGPWWGTYFLSIEPQNGVAATQFSAVLQKHICNQTVALADDPSLAGDANNGGAPAASSGAVVAGVAVGAIVLAVGGVIVFRRRKNLHMGSTGPEHLLDSKEDLARPTLGKISVPPQTATDA